MVKVFNEKARDSRDGIYFYLSPIKFASEETFAVIKEMKPKIDKNELSTVSLKQWVSDDFEKFEFAISGQALYWPE